MKVAVITGASSGIGLELARELSWRGVAVSLLARRKNLVDEAVLQLNAQGGSAIGFECDVTDRNSVAAAVRATEERFGAVDLAVANAGVGIPTPLRKFSLDDAVQVVTVNYIGMLNLIGAVLPKMLERKSGHLVGIASLAGFRALPTSAGYSASKAAMQTFLEAARVELRAKGVKVTIVNPGFVETAMTEKHKGSLPFVISVDKAALRIADAIEQQVAVLSFPLASSIAMKLVRILPGGLYDLAMGPLARRRVDETKVKR